MARIAVVGSLNMDLVAHAPRLPAVGETVSDARFGVFPGGKGANQAVAASRLGAAVAMIGRVGGDGYGVALRQGLTEDGVDTTGVGVEVGSASGVALIAVDSEGRNTIIVAPGANAYLSPTHVDVAGAAIRAAQSLLLQFETPIDASVRAAEIARDAGALVVLNPAPARDLPPALAKLVDWILPNETEAAALLGRAVSAIAKDPEGAALALRRATGVPNIGITLGAGGAVLSTADRALRLPAPSVKVADTVAAGDAFVAGFAVAMAEGRDLESALRMALAAGSLACTIPGAQPALPARAAVDALMA